MRVLHVYISFPQLSDFVPSKTGFVVSAHKLINITLLTVVHTSYAVVPRGVVDLYL